MIKGLSQEEYERLKREKPHLLKRWGLLEDDGDEDRRKAGCCPECGAPLSFEGGCCLCHSCGYSECG